MRKKYLIAISFFAVLLASCAEKEKYTKKPFYDLHKKHIGDSIFLNDDIKKIIFIDTSYEIDSIVFSWYSKVHGNLKSAETFKGGKNVFENIEYHENGNIKKYLFVDEDNPNYYYERLYHENGTLLKITGYLFFQGFIVDTTSKSLDIKKGTTINYRIYYPNPPDCISRIYIKNDDGSIYDVFKKSSFLNFMQTTYQDNNIVGTYKVNIMFEQRDKSMDTTFLYNRAIIYKVVQ
ncbi:MAG: hypothetical protein JST95_02405 [Bacteroidetes bacterium]|nr:hypothetical protein [Bacteroidota bacterium]